MSAAIIKKTWQGLAVGLTSAAVALAFWGLGAMDRFEAKTWDWRVTALARPGAFTERIKLVFIDQQSLDWVNNAMALRWPWPREVYRPILEFCRRQGAKAVAFDLLFTEPSSYGVEDDLSFGAAIAETAGFVNTIFLGHEHGIAAGWPEYLPARMRIAGLNEWLVLPGRASLIISKAIFPVPQVATNAALLGNVEAEPDPDAIFRRMPLFAVFDGRPVPTLGLAAGLAATNLPLSIAADFLRVGAQTVPIDRSGKTVLRFRGPSGTHARFSAAAVIQSELNLQAGETPPITDTNLFKNCYVFFGCNAPGLLDLRPTPVGHIYSGVEIHATLLDNLLSGDFMRDAPFGLTIAMALVLGALWGVLTLAARNPRETVAAFLIALPLPAVLCVLAYQRGVWLPFILPETTTALALVGAVLVNYATEGRQKRFIRGAFRQYLSEHVIEQLVQNPDRLQLGGEQRELSIFFSDLQGFTGISEGLNPQELTGLLNEYLTAMTDIIQEEGGTVDKYEGDAIIAFWNAPLPQPDHARRAVHAALRCQQKLAEMRPALRAKTGKDLFMRIGINTGPVVVGNMGSRNRFNYTILGDAANLASRLEGINKQFGTYTMISETTRAAMGTCFKVRELSRVAVVGRKTPVRVFEPFNLQDASAPNTDLSAFAEALHSFYQGHFAEALAVFQKIQADDPPAAAYARKCRDLLEHPPADWQGVWVMTEK